MGEIILIRHGQANSAANDEAGYDRLSDLGWQQSRWLGDYLRTQPHHDRVLCGALRRHTETLAALGDGFGPPAEIDPRLNEMDYFNLGRALTQANGRRLPATAEEHASHMTEVMEAWHRAEIRGQEGFDEFEARVTAVLDEAAEPGRRVLCITSGGVIGMMMRGLLGLEPRSLAHVLLPILNASIHRIEVTPFGHFLGCYNATPHLDTPERRHARTPY
jgi:broad specificity phosphatase PhoE